MRSLTRPRPAPAPAPAPDHGQANAKMTGCCCNCASWGGWVVVWEVGVWMRLASRRQLKSNERAASLGRLIAGRCSASMAKNVHTPPLSLSHSRSSAWRTFGNHWNSHIKEGTESESCQFASYGSGQLDSMDYSNFLFAFTAFPYARYPWDMAQKLAFCGTTK